MSSHGRTRVLAVAVLLGAPGLGVLGGDPRTAIALLSAALTDAPSVASGDPTAPLLAAVALAAWACAAWLLLLVALVGLGRRNGRMGQAAHRLGSWVAPASVRAVVGLAVGVTVTGTVLAGPAVATEPTPAPSASAATATASQTARPSLDWPTTPAAPTTPIRPAASATPTQPAATAAAAASTSLAPAGTSTATSPTATSPTATSPAAAGSEPPHRAITPTPAAEKSEHDAVPAPGAVVVQAGDSLWGIAARDLGASATPARIAQAWPQWWQANRAVLGTDPDLIHPGTSLTDPTR